VNLVLAFDTDDPEFVRGVEVGMILSTLEARGYYEGTVHVSNAEMIMRVAEASGLPFELELGDGRLDIVIGRES
jgi:hypothetical protein